MGRKRVKKSTKRLSLTKKSSSGVVTKVAKMKREAATGESIDIEEMLESSVIFTNDGSIRTRNGLKNGEQIQRTPKRSRTKASNVPASESTSGKVTGERPILTRLLRVRSRDSPKKPIEASCSVAVANNAKLQMMIVLNKIEDPVQEIAVRNEIPLESELNCDLKPADVIPVSKPENSSEVGQFQPLLSSTAVEERLKSPQRARYLLKQLESSLSPKYMELTKTTVGHAMSRYGRVQKQKENSDYIPLDLARFITKSPAKARTIKKDSETVPPIEPIVPSPIGESDQASFETSQLDVINSSSLTETPIVSPAQLSTIEIPSQLQKDSEPECCNSDKSDIIPIINPNASLLGIDEIQIVDLDASFGENAVVEAPNEIKIKEELAKSPEKSSEVDSAEGSSLGSTLSTEYRTGQLLWGAFNNKSVHWPCIVIPDPEDGLMKKLANAKKWYLVHVNFFADNGRRAWIPESLTLPFSTLEEYKALVDSQFKILRLKVNQYQRQRPMWIEAIRQAEETQKQPIDARKKRFQELLEVDGAKSKQLLRKRAKSLSTGYHSNSFDASSEFGRKRRRSPTPESPAYEALPTTSRSSEILSKRIKLESDDRDLFRSTISRYFQSMTEGSDFLETASGTSSESDDISEMVEFDKEIYNNFLTMSRLYVFEGQTETEVDRKLQKYVQKICALRMHSIANGARISNRLRSQALRKLGRELGIDKAKKEPNSQAPVEAAASSMAAVKPKKRVQKSLDDLFMFDLEKNYLMKGVARGSVCTVCSKPNDLVKCSKCCNHYHAGCSTDPSAEASSTESKAFICLDCTQQKAPVCFVCHDQEDSVKEDQKYRCTVGGCGKHYHVPCLRLFPQHKFTGTSQSSTLFCPYHTCHTCVSDDPRTNATSTKGQLVRCIKCPSSYHTEAKCIPAGSQILSWAAMICPKHNLEQSSLNVNWCFLCCKGGSLICCETCPTAFHLDCLKFTPPEGKYICEECESGRMPLYNEIVWAKYSHFRFWPAMTVPPPMVPENLKQLPHEKWDICVRFFGTHDHVWINRRRIYLYQEGDSDISEKKRGNMAKRYNSALQDAKLVHEMLQARKAAEQLTEVGEGSFKPPMYVKIKSNRYVAPLKAPSQGKEEEDNACECKPTDDDPCGPDSNCINRALLVECNPKVCPAKDRCQNQCFEKKQYPALVAKRISQKGWGLVTMEDIRQGQFVIEYVGEVINNEELARRLQHKVEQKDENYYFLTVDSELTIDAGPKGNLARFINHSCEPNCETMLWKVGGAQAVGLFAIKDLKAGDELTFNYNFESKGDKKKICLCNATKCSGYIGQKYRPPVEQAIAAIGVSKGRKAGKNRKSAKRRRQSSYPATLFGDSKRRKSTVDKTNKVAGSIKSIKSNSVQQVDAIKVEPLDDEPENRATTIADPTKESNDVAIKANQ
ncbi:nuclear receptor binding SET domain protein isoform X2 [Ochlerotatus camptorhynchus]|uniref:nuclear receptor binding SET domain protein isoform X2 n=1 Tax=Ochlerotatus camptorhynchus TaxID=644619 RepID=UPI0031DB8C52